MFKNQRLDYAIANNASTPYVAVVDSEGNSLVTFPLPPNSKERAHMELLIIGAVQAANDAQESNLDRLLIRAATHCASRRITGMTPMQEAVHRALIEAAAKAVDLPVAGVKYRSTDPSLEGLVIVTSVANGRVFYTGDAEGDATIQAFWQGFDPLESYDVNVKVSVRCARSAEAAVEQVQQLMDYAFEVSNDDSAFTGYAVSDDNELSKAVAAAVLDMCQRQVSKGRSLANINLDAIVERVMHNK
jgi:hypothetical protein